MSTKATRRVPPETAARMELGMRARGLDGKMYEVGHTIAYNLRWFKVRPMRRTVAEVAETSEDPDGATWFDKVRG